MCKVCTTGERCCPHSMAICTYNTNSCGPLYIIQTASPVFCFMITEANTCHVPTTSEKRSQSHHSSPATRTLGQSDHSRVALGEFWVSEWPEGLAGCENCRPTLSTVGLNQGGSTHKASTLHPFLGWPRRRAVVWLLQSLSQSGSSEDTASTNLLRIGSWRSVKGINLQCVS